MKAAVIYGTKNVRIDHISEPNVLAGQVKVQVEWAGISRSDLEAYHLGIGTFREQSYNSNKRLSLSFGYAFAGVISEIGQNVDHLRLGDKVAVEPMFFAIADHYDSISQHRLSGAFDFLSLNMDSGFAEYAITDSQWVHKLPEELSLEEGVLMVPAAIALHAVSLSGLDHGHNIVVCGAGASGVFTIMAAKAAGASRIVAVDECNERLEKALETGATEAVNTLEADLPQEIDRLLPDGPDLIFETTGADSILAGTGEIITKRGKVVPMSLQPEPLSIAVDIPGSHNLGYRERCKQALIMMAAQQFSVKELLPKRIRFDQLIEEGLDYMFTADPLIQILVKVSADDAEYGEFQESNTLH